jgi:hypothetical protein
MMVQIFFHLGVTFYLGWRICICKLKQMTNILPIPTNVNQHLLNVLVATDMKLSDLVKMKAATLKSLVGCSGEEENKIPINVTK